MTTYVINPITDELESTQPRQRVADKFKLEDLLTPGPLRDELKGDFDPTQETYEEYLRRINLRYGGRVNFSEGSDFLSVKEIQSLIPDELKKTLKPGDTRGRLLFSPSNIQKAYDRGFKKRFAKLKLGLTYLRELDNELKGVDSFPTPQGRTEFIQKFSELPEVKNLLKQSGFKSIQDFQNSRFSRKNYLNQTIDSLLKGKATKGTGRAPGDFKTVRTGPIGQVDKIIVNKLLTDVLGDNAQFFISEGSLPNEISLQAQREGRSDLRRNRLIMSRYNENLDLGFGSEESRNIYKNQNKTAIKTKNLNAALGLTNNINLRFARTHYFPIMAGGEMKRLNLLVDGLNYSDKYTFRPSYSNQLQNVFYDTPIRNAVAKFKGGKINIKQLASELDNIATKFKRNFPDIEVAELKLNKNNKFSFKKDFPSITKESRLNKIALTRNAINELENAYVVSSAGAMDDTKFNQLKKDYNFVNEKYRNIFNPVFTQENIELIKTRSTLRNKILKATGKTAKVTGKILKPLGVATGFLAVNTALKAGERNVFDLTGAYLTAEPEVASINRMIRENEEFAKKYEGALPEIVSEDVIPMTREEEIQKIKDLDLPEMDQTMMAAEGGRVGFQDGTPPVIPGNEPDYSELQVMLDNPNEYNTFPKGTFTEELDKAVYGTNEERNLLQKFNSMFLDPRVYPYYSQKLASGAANIPELAFRFPAALAYLYGQGNLALASGDLDRIKGKTLVEALEILDPKYTREIKNTKFGDVIGISDKSMNEKDKTEGQKLVGDTFQLGAEAVGPATPLFLFKMFPKLPKQIKDLVGTASAAEKVNKEIEKNLAVDQSKRDLILTIGAGGAVAALKFLGLDKLIKAPKATKAVTSAVKSGGTPQYFFDFVDLIKRKGKDVSDRQAVVERQKVIEYKDYTLTDTDGYITVRKTDEDMGRDEMMEYKPPEGVVDEATGKSTEVPAQYEEVTAKPDANDPGNFDADQGFDSIEDVLDELSKDGKKYTVKELEEMGINLGSATKTEMAEGGIIAGVKSGPAPKSGPTPHGLPYLAKNVTPIKERK